MTIEQIQTTAAAAKAAGIDYDDALSALEEGYGIRRVCGFRVRAGWGMPDPPQPGLVPVVMFHGGDGLGFHWGDPEKPWREVEEFDSDKHDPLMEHDTGSGYKACQEAYAELGFEVL